MSDTTNPPLTRLASMETMGGYGSFRLEIHAIHANPAVLTDERVITGANQAIYDLKNILDTAAVLRNPEYQKEIEGDKRGILELFEGKDIYVETLPNGYFKGHPYFGQFPWFKITTRIGHFVVGRRKRVHVIDWSGTTLQTPAEELFPDLDVTKDGPLIHIYNREQGLRVIQTVFKTALDQPLA